MNNEHIVTHPPAELIQNRVGSAPALRLGVRLTVAERKLLLAVVDLALMNASLIIAAAIWVGFDPSPVTIVAYYKWFITLSLLWWACGTLFDVYNLKLANNVNGILAASGLAALLTSIIYVLIPFFTPTIASRSYVAGFILLGTGSIMAWRFLYAKGLSQPAFQRRVLIAGTGSTAQVLFRELVVAKEHGDDNPFAGTGYQIVGLLTDAYSDIPSDEVGLPVLGDMNQLVRIARQYRR